MILPYILKIICWTNTITGILVPCGASICLIKCMWVSYLHFMVQWFCHILKTVWLINVVLEILNQCDTNTELNNICRSETYISWSSDFALYLEDYLMDKCHNWNIGSMWCKDLPHKMYVGKWHTFHSPVILFYILKTIWWINVVLEILIQCATNIELKIYM